MSFIIAVHVNEGIVVASDSRSTLNKQQDRNGKTIIQSGVHTTDTTYKTFLCPGRIGIATCGDASINSMPIAGYIEAFIREKINQNTLVDDVPSLLIEYFQQFVPVPDTNFIVTGFKEVEGKFEQSLYKIRVKRKSIEKIDTNSQGAAWEGETVAFAKVVKPVAIKNGDNYTDLPYYEIPFNLFTLQDAVNFARFAVDVTIQTMHFQSVIESVGGPVDILVLKPDEAFWIERKKLH